MDNKFKFEERCKTFMKADNQQGVYVDPYIFSEPEPFGSSIIRKNFISNNKTNLKTSGAKGRCVKKKLKLDDKTTPIQTPTVINTKCLTDNRNCFVIPKQFDDNPNFMKNHIQVKFPQCPKEKKNTYISTTNNNININIHNNSKNKSVNRSRISTNNTNHSGSINNIKDKQSTSSTSSPIPKITIAPLPLPSSSSSSSSTALNPKEVITASAAARDHTLLYYPRAGDEISDSDSSSDEFDVYQRHWFTHDTSNISRSNRLSLLRSQLRRRIIQLNKDTNKDSDYILRKRTRRLLESSNKNQLLLSKKLKSSYNNNKVAGGVFIVGGKCGIKGCRQTSLPCTRHCARHIMFNPDQILFEHCTAKFSDNTQCCIPVFDVAHELPLCPEHARKRDNYHRKSMETKPKKSRKKLSLSPPSSLISPSLIIPKIKNSNTNSSKSNRSKKRKRPSSTNNLNTISISNNDLMTTAPTTITTALNSINCTNNSNNSIINTTTCDENSAINSTINNKLTNVIKHEIIVPDDNHYSCSIIPQNDNLKTLNNFNVMTPSSSNHINLNANLNSNLNLGLGLNPLGLGNSLKNELPDHDVFAALEASDHDFSNVLNNLPPDAFNDIFIESRNGEYEPTREEQEELERALEAVNKDVRNLERTISIEQTHLLEPALLAQLMSDIAS